ncbi:MAG TPA: glycoside hydrolase family 16 protein [Paludibacter sp.]|nr:glycoside hydrolase family 16 protein [Paludibacter sp.]
MMIKKFILTGCLFISFFAAAQDYKLVWEDDFEKCTINKKNWTIEVDGYGGGNRELQYYRKQNIRIEKEPVTGEKCLVITAKTQNFKGKPATSGRITTQYKKTFKYGKIEARIKLPKTADGLWPAFWMLGVDKNEVDWPKCGEIDILEMGNKKGIDNGTQDRYFNGACHWGESWNGGSYPNKGIPTTNDYSLQEDFHTYTLIWTQDSIIMYLDIDKFPNAKPYFQMPIVGENLPNQTSLYFRKPFYIIFNLAVGGTFPQIYDINQISALANGNAKMYIDYVRVYQKR